MSADGYRDDIRWQAAHRDYVDDRRPGETARGVYERRTGAVDRLYDIECEYERAESTERPRPHPHAVGAATAATSRSACGGSGSSSPRGGPDPTQPTSS